MCCGRPTDHYLIDFYSANGRLFESKRIVADDNAAAQDEAKILADEINAASFKITCLLKYGNIIISNSFTGTYRRESSFYPLKNYPDHALGTPLIGLLISEQGSKMART